ncbi:MAG: hypothetical protein Q9226_009054 [Calogaya cf. arnoldii]
MDPSRKRQRGGGPPHNNDGDDADDLQERTNKQRHFRADDVHDSRHSPLFLSRNTSEEPLIAADDERSIGKLKSKIPSFLDSDDEEAFVGMGFRSAAHPTYELSKPHPAASSSTQQQNSTTARSGTHITSVNPEPATSKSTVPPPSQATRPPSSSTAPNQRPKQTTSTRVIKPPREPNEALKRYTTSLYARYDPLRKNVGPVAGKFDGTFKIYNAYTLVVNPTMAIGNLPTSGVRVDDFLAGKLLMSNHSSKVLHQAWPAEFDHNGMIRATRIPLGHAAKQWRKVGDTDIDGKVVQPGQEGWYYDWWRGLHCLMGKEGYDAGMYLVRPSWEKFLCEGMTFKIGCKAVVQLPTGDPNDRTLGL